MGINFTAVGFFFVIDAFFGSSGRPLTLPAAVIHPHSQVNHYYLRRGLLRPLELYLALLRHLSLSSAAADPAAAHPMPTTLALTGLALRSEQRHADLRELLARAGPAARWWLRPATGADDGEAGASDETAAALSGDEVVQRMLALSGGSGGDGGGSGGEAVGPPPEMPAAELAARAPWLLQRAVGLGGGKGSGGAAGVRLTAFVLAAGKLRALLHDVVLADDPPCGEFALSAAAQAQLEAAVRAVFGSLATKSKMFMPFKNCFEARAAPNGGLPTRR